MLRDMQEDVAWQQRESAVVYFTPNGNTLSITYTNPGWYMLQGNNRHSGNTEYPLAADLYNLQNTVSQKWSTALPTMSWTPTTAATSMPDNEPYAEFVPSVVVVPNYTNPSSGLPVLYVPVNDKKILGAAAPSGNTRIWRIEDTGSGYNAQSFDLPAHIQITGTPIVVGTQLENGTPGHKLVVAGFKLIADDAGHVTGSEGHVIRYDVTGSGQSLSFTERWHYVFPVSQPVRGVYASPGYWNGTTRYKNEAGSPRTYTGGVILVPVFNGDTPSGNYLIALALDTNNPAGQNVWGYVTDSTGALVYHDNSWGGLPLMQNSDYWTEHSSPAVSIIRGRAYASVHLPDREASGVVARELETGQPPAEEDWYAGSGTVDAQTVSVSGDRFYTGRTFTFNGWQDIYCSGSNPWELTDVAVPSGLSMVWAPAAFYPQDHTAVVAAGVSSTGLFGVATDNDVSWGNFNNVLGSPKWSSASVVGTQGATANACLTSSDDEGAAHTDIYGLTAPSQGAVLKTLSGLSGLVYGNQAAYGSSITGRCRLYVVTGGIYQIYPSLTQPAMLYCIAQ
jgi:hypothetical protein